MTFVGPFGVCTTIAVVYDFDSRELYV